MIRASSVQPTATPGSPSGASIRAASGSCRARGRRARRLGPLADDRVLEQRQLAGDGVQPVEVARVDHQEAGAGQVDHPREEVAPVGQVDRALHPAGLLDPEPHREVLLAVGQQRRHRLPRPQPARDQRVRHPVRPRVHLAVRAATGPRRRAGSRGRGAPRPAPGGSSAGPTPSGPRARTSPTTRSSGPAVNHTAAATVCQLAEWPPANWHTAPQDGDAGGRRADLGRGGRLDRAAARPGASRRGGRRAPSAG